MQVGTSGAPDAESTCRTPVPGRKHYAFARYCHSGRWESYYVQLRETLDLAPQSVLEVGVGDGFFGSYLRRVGVEYRSIDILGDLQPDIVAAMTHLPLKAASFDVVCAFQVLEHLRWHDVPIALAELARVARHYVLISLPRAGPYVQFALKVPLFPPIRMVAKIPWPIRNYADPEHFWEVGKIGFSRRSVRALLRRQFRIKNELLVFGFPYHRFYLLEVSDFDPAQRGGPSRAGGHGG
jgi:SAM-dependent methyltransferase